MLMQNFGVINKEHYGMLWYFWSGQFKGLEKHSRELTGSLRFDHSDGNENVKKGKRFYK